MIIRRASFVLVAAACAAPLATAALAARAPSASELTGIARAQGVPARCLYVRVSTINRRFAKLAFRLPPSHSCVRYVANGVRVMRYAGRRWRQVFAGSDIRCPIPGVSTAVARDLRVCP